MNASKVIKTFSDLNAQFHEQIIILKNACENFDNWAESEALNIAVRLRVLLHDSKYSSSLLQRIWLKAEKFISTRYNYSQENFINY